MKRISEKASKHYDLAGADELWLVIFACAPQWGATAATFLFPPALDCQRLSALTTSILQASQFIGCQIFCELADGGPRLYSWTRGGHWSEVTLPGPRTDSGPWPSFWDIQKLFKA